MYKKCKNRPSFIVRSKAILSIPLLRQKFDIGSKLSIFTMCSGMINFSPAIRILRHSLIAQASQNIVLLQCIAFISTSISFDSALAQTMSMRYGYSIWKVLTQGSSGTGFLVKTETPGQCLFLTAAHVAEQSVNDEDIEFVNANSRYKLKRKDFKTILEIDAAYSPTKCDGKDPFEISSASMASLGARVTIPGYPVDNSSEKYLEPVRGLVTEINLTPNQSGFNISYDAHTSVGYSGSPIILDSKGVVIGLHGRSDQLERGSKSIKVGGSGISIDIILDKLRQSSIILPVSQQRPCMTISCF